MPRACVDRDADAVLARSVELARQAREDSGLSPDEAWVAASVGPYGASRADGSEYTGDYGLDVAQLREWHRPRLQTACRGRTRCDRDRDDPLARRARGGLPRARWSRGSRLGERHDRGRPAAVGRLARRGVRARRVGCGGRRGRSELLRCLRGERRSRRAGEDPAGSRVPQQRRGVARRFARVVGRGILDRVERRGVGHRRRTTRRRMLPSRSRSDRADRPCRRLGRGTWRFARTRSPDRTPAAAA